MRWSIWIIILAVAGFALWVRLAPTKPDQWHVALGFEQDSTEAGGAKRVIPADAPRFAALDEIIRATPRTSLVAGSLDEEHLTYATRSALWGFPDYTTIQRVNGQIRIWGRLRFGQSDLAVNAGRIDGWLEVLAEG